MAQEAVSETKIPPLGGHNTFGEPGVSDCGTILF